MIIAELVEALEGGLRTAGGRTGDKQAVVGTDTEAEGSGDNNCSGSGIGAQQAVLEIGVAEAEGGNGGESVFGAGGRQLRLLC